MPSSHNNRHQLDCMSDDDEFAYDSRNKSEQNNNSKMGRKKKNPQQSLQSELSGLPPTPSEDKVKAGVRFSKQRAQKNASRSAPQTQRNSKTAQNASRSRKPSRNDSNDERGLESLDDPHNSPSFMANAAAKVSSMASNTLNFINDKQKQHKKRRIENSKGGGVLGDIGCETLKFSKTPKLSNQSAKHHEAQRNDQSHQAENALNFADNFQNSSPARKSPNNNNNRQGRDWHQSKNSSNNNHNSNNHHNQKSYGHAPSHNTHNNNNYNYNYNYNHNNNKKKSSSSSNFEQGKFNNDYDNDSNYNFPKQSTRSSSSRKRNKDGNSDQPVDLISDSDTEGGNASSGSDSELNLALSNSRRQSLSPAKSYGAGDWLSVGVCKIGIGGKIFSNECKFRMKGPAQTMEISYKSKATSETLTAHTIRCNIEDDENDVTEAYLYLNGADISEGIRNERLSLSLSLSQTQEDPLFFLALRVKPTADSKNIKKGNGLHLYTNKYAQDEEKLARCRESADRFHHGYVVLELRDDSESTKKDVDRMLKNAKLKEVSEQQAKTKRLLCLLLARLSRFARGSLRSQLAGHKTN